MHRAEDATDLLWTAPEVLRRRRKVGGVSGVAAAAANDGAQRTQPADVFSFAIILQVRWGSGALFSSFVGFQ